MRGGAGGGNQYGKGNQAAAMQRQMMQHRYRMMQSGSGHQNGTGQQQRFRDGSWGGQVGNQGAVAMQEQMMQIASSTGTVRSHKSMYYFSEIAPIASNSQIRAVNGLPNLGSWGW